MSTCWGFSVGACHHYQAIVQYCCSSAGFQQPLLRQVVHGNVAGRDKEVSRRVSLKLLRQCHGTAPVELHLYVMPCLELLGEGSQGISQACSGIHQQASISANASRGQHKE